LQRRITELTEQAAIEPGVFVPIDSTLRGTRKFDLGTLIAGLAGQYPIWDDESGCYTNESIHNWLNARNDGLAYGISMPKTASTECSKTGANAGIANPVPGIIGRPAVDPYVGRGAFRFYNVNATVDADGTPHVTAIEGDGRFRRDGSNGDVWVMAPVLYWTYDDSDTEAVTFSVSDSRLSGMEPQPHAYLPDGTLRPYMLYAKYAGVKGSDGYMHSYSGHPIWNRTVSHDSLRTQCRTSSTGYSGKNVADMWYMQVMLLLKYATKNIQSILRGCTDYNYQVAPTVAETGTTRVIVSNANANNLLVGSAMMLGSHGSSNSDRNTAANYDVFDGKKILRIETYDANNKAVYVETATTFNTATTQLFSTAPWHTGACDQVEGDGSPTNCTSGKEPYVIQGIECALGMYEVLGNVIISNDGSTGWVPLVNHDSRNEATSVTSNYVSCGTAMPTDTNDSWKYPLYAVCLQGLWYGTTAGGSQSQGMCDGHYTNKMATTGTREWQSGGGLNVGGSAGPWCVTGGSGLTGASWGIGSRLSGVGRSRG
jgi:hypothetical protein